MQKNETEALKNNDHRSLIVNNRLFSQSFSCSLPKSFLPSSLPKRKTKVMPISVCNVLQTFHTSMYTIKELKKLTQHQPIPTAVMSVTALTGFIFTPAIPINPASSTVIETTISITIIAAHGLKIKIEMTMNTEAAITQIAKNKCHLKTNPVHCV